MTKYPILAPKSCKSNESAIGGTYDDDDGDGGGGGGGDDIQFGRLQRATNLTILLLRRWNLEGGGFANSHTPKVQFWGWRVANSTILGLDGWTVAGGGTEERKGGGE